MWAIYSIISALALSTRNVVTKTSLNKTSQYFTMWITVVGVFLFSGAVALFTGMEIKDSSFWTIVTVRVLFDTFAFIAFIKALNIESVTYVIPLLAFMPVTSSISAYFINGQSVSRVGILGIAIIVLSGILMFKNELDRAKTNINFDKKKVLLATLYISITILGWTIVDPIHKEGVDSSTPYTYFFISNVFFLVIFTILLLLNDRKAFGEFARGKYPPVVGILGILLGIEFGSQLLALTSGLTSFIVSIKSTNIAISSLLAWWLLKEKLSATKIVGIIGSVVGVLILILG